MRQSSRSQRATLVDMLIGVGGFVDGSVLHQIGRWDHMLSDIALPYTMDTIANEYEPPARYVRCHAMNSIPLRRKDLVPWWVQQPIAAIARTDTFLPVSRRKGPFYGPLSQQIAGSGWENGHAAGLEYPRTFYTDVNGLFCKAAM